MRVLICAGRFYADTKNMTRILELYSQSHRIQVVIHGGHQSSGGIIESWARDADIHVVRYPANWAMHGKYAELRRNLFMLEDSKPDAILAFPGGEDTADCIRQAKKAGITVVEVDL
ncbi:hypothetical protein AwEntero_22230 [Enterobacterales bacterium]|nr:hypothetical protein AwEntero_22230 [Enterobacterales bacterium]